jgi:hypothetical protein
LLATIFIGDECIENELAFLEDVSDSIYKQLTPPGSVVNVATQDMYSQYSNIQYTGQRACLRMTSIAQALMRRVNELAEEGHVFLVIDHLDLCSPSLKELLRRDLAVLQDRGLRILVTSRLPRHEPAIEKFCDYHDDDCPIQIYWHCPNCEGDICEACKGEQSFGERW